MKKRYSDYSSSCKKYLIAILLFLGMTGLVTAQNIDFGAGCPNSASDLANQTVGTAITFVPITAINLPAGTLVMSIQNISVDGLGTVPGPYTSPFLLNSGPLTTDITFTVNPTTISFSTPGGGINPAAAGKVVHFTLRATVGGSQCDKTYNFKIIAPASLMLVLDGSGSMAWGFDGNVTPPAGQRRWDGLVTGTGAMVTQFGAVSLINADSLGLRLFSTGVIVPPAPFNGGNLVSLQTNFPQLSTVLTPDPPGGSTALGDGILAGTNMQHPGPASYQKSMIVFSDGIQNFGDLVKEVGLDAYKVTNSLKSISDGDKIKIYTIGLGTSGSLPVTMESIATNNGGAYLNAETTGADFATFFSTQFANIFAGRSPQFIDIKKASFPVATGNTTATTSQNFSVNKGVSSLVVTMLAPNNTEAHFTSIKKGTLELIQFAQQSSGSGFRSLTIRVPSEGLPDSVRLNGEWKVAAQLGSHPPTETPYTLMILADDHALHPEYSIAKGNFKVGDALDAKVTLMHSGKSITNANVQAIVLRPGDDVNDLLARSDVKFNLPPVDSASPDVAKLAELLKDSNFVNKIKSQNQLINLAYDAADSSYKGSFNGLTIAGVYQIIFLTTATDAEIDKIQRYHQMSFYVRFPDIDLGNSNVLVSLDSLGNSILTARFITSKGKFLGSGWKSVINIDAGGLKISKIDDVGDGTYKILFNGKLEGNGVITISTDTIYNGDLGNIGKGGGGGTEIWKHWWFWVLLLIIIIIIITLSRKKKGP